MQISLVNSGRRTGGSGRGSSDSGTGDSGVGDTGNTGDSGGTGGPGGPTADRPGRHLAPVPGAGPAANRAGAARSGRPGAPARAEAGRTGDADPCGGAEIIELFGAGPVSPAGATGDGAPRLRRLGWILVGCGVALLPWLVVLATALPAAATAAHWPLAWVGLDTAEAAGLIATGLLAARGDARHALTAAATAALLAVDAWFDTTTAATGGDLLSALAMAVFAELPLAALCAALAVRGLRRSR